ncbi:uncharacterized protein BCR38DRAFT_82308 [Pseudomassariella vexata]|uniref:FHA domain-containing protein n=1 Tax=Pseudomassariella vexata TaxID=1141098 RepID=A0A1Y2DFP0_9PEZI|nr:uncharacterized protein BCR38DRAFT_82308 [Pseudomassariella vexata]ORY57914.1 hypothetical protein BCR38DRAFT_82308 [Pseudomassariella vexata]
MWILENEGEAIDGKRLWLRPGKRYLFGRTVAEPGMLAIKGEKANTVSRKHVIIQVDPVCEGEGQNPRGRSKVTVEDLCSKIGTTVNGKKFKGEKYVITTDENVLQMGSLQAKFRITWFPVVLSYSFTGKELRSNPLTKLRTDLEQLDIKFFTDYMPTTTHVVARKRNTPKGLQALINGRYIVNDRFVEAVVAAATPQQLDGGVEMSLLERDFDSYWPNALEFLPLAGDEPVPRAVEDFSPNPERTRLFEGYTFIFYEQKQFDTLLGPITNGGGKAVFKVAIPGETQIDDFIRFVKEIAGEKGLGEFEDGSEGKGAVVVRFLPINGETLDWFSEFYTAVSLRLDHRLIDQKDFIGAILGNDASVLRRPLEVETQRTSQGGPAALEPHPIEVDENPAREASQPSASRRRIRGVARSRFKGFDVDLDSDNEVSEGVPASAPVPAVNESSQEGGLFVSQNPASAEPEETTRAGRRSQRKRPASPIPEPPDIMEEFAPNAAQVKRRRIERGETPIPRDPTPSVDEGSELSASKSKQTKKSPKVKKEVDILKIARQHREEAEARARREREELATAPEGLDLAEIRRLQIEEPMEIRQAPPQVRGHDKDVADGRWNPAWNGRQNFKKFRQCGAATVARPHLKTLIALEEVKSKGFGIGDDYWLQDTGGQKKKSQNRSQSRGLSSGADASNTQNRSQTAASRRECSSELEANNDGVDDSEDAAFTSGQSRANKAAQSFSTQSLRMQTSQIAQSGRTTKRTAAASPPEQQPAKKARITTIAASDDDDSDDELRFRFRFTKR